MTCSLQARFIFLLLIFAIPSLVCSGPIGERRESFQTEPNYESGNILDAWNDEMGTNADEMGNYFQGDIIIDPTEARSMVTNTTLLWPGALVPYVIVGPYNEEGMELLAWAIDEFTTKTCITMRPKEPADNDYLVFTNNKTGCWSFLGRQGGRQEINLQHPACMRVKRKGTILHEIMHALGFVHEHTRPDRDEYIQILWNNVRPPMWVNFQKTSYNDVSNHEVPYDYGSLMQYSMFAFSTEGYKRQSLRPKISKHLYQDPNQSFKLGQRNEFSEKDIYKINKLYCSESAENVETTLFPIFKSK